MSWISQQPDSLTRDWLQRTQSPMLATKPDGEILWCNKSFESLIEYTEPELVGKITWKQLTADEEDLETDITLAKETVSGDRESYMLQKPYRTKSGPEKRVVIDVLRYPRHGPFECFLVTAIPIDRGIEFAMGELAYQREMLLQIATQVEGSGFPIDKMLKFASEHPIWFTVLSILVAYLIIGERVIEILKLIKE